jgi:hypothetical protein
MLEQHDIYQHWQSKANCDVPWHGCLLIRIFRTRRCRPGKADLNEPITIDLSVRTQTEASSTSIGLSHTHNVTACRLATVHVLIYVLILRNWNMYYQIKIVCNFTLENQNISFPCNDLLYINTTLEYGDIDPYSVYAPTCTNLTAYSRNHKMFTPVHV